MFLRGGGVKSSARIHGRRAEVARGSSQDLGATGDFGGRNKAKGQKEYFDISTQIGRPKCKTATFCQNILINLVGLKPEINRSGSCNACKPPA